MDIFDAASYFDRLTFKDSYTGLPVFKGQFDVYDDGKRDALMVERRIVSVDPAVVIPARHAVNAQGKDWILGTAHPDYFYDSPIRVKYVAQQSDGLATVRTFSQACAATGGFTAHCGRIWLKESKETSESANLYPVYDLMCAPGEPLAPFQMVFVDSRWHLIRLVYVSPAGLTVGIADELPEPVLVSATWHSLTLNPVTETTTDVQKVVPAVLIRWQSAYEHLTVASMHFVPGDEIGIMRISDGTPKTNDKFEIAGVTRQVLAVTPIGDSLRLHLRHG